MLRLHCIWWWMSHITYLAVSISIFEQSEADDDGLRCSALATQLSAGCQRLSVHSWVPPAARRVCHRRRIL